MEIIRLDCLRTCKMSDEWPSLLRGETALILTAAVSPYCFGIYVPKSKVHLVKPFCLQSKETLFRSRLLTAKLQNWDLSRSLKYGWCIAAFADTRFAGSNVSILERRSSASGPISGTALDRLWACHWGYSCQSRSFFTPGHESSVGVPSNLKMCRSCCNSESPGKSGVLRDNSANMHPTDHISTDVE